MARPVDIEAVLAGPARPGVVLRRGLMKRCPRCGGGHLYRGWFRMKERCPTCGYRFEREPGFFVGSYFLNVLVSQGLVWILLLGFVLWKSGHPDAGVVVPAVVGGVIAVVTPLVFYPFSRTLWSAFDLAFTPLDVKEIVEAVDAVDDGTADDPGEPDVPGRLQ